MRYETIQGYPNYTIYEDGTIINHTIFYLHNHTIVNGRGPVVRLIDENKKAKNIAVSRTLAETFIPNPENKPKVSFRDKDVKNINLDNLYWANQGEYLIRYTEEERIQARKAAHKRSRERRNVDGSVNQEQRNWRQSDAGKFTRNRNHWIAAGIREPPEGWHDFYFLKFTQTTHCELCSVAFLPEEDYMSQRCLEHDHHSRYYRSICCRKCNSGPMKTYDQHRAFLLIELHRYFNLK
jgi:hypothetical protein